jgi:hypothetical protein
MIGVHIKSASGGKTDLARIRQDASKDGYNPDAKHNARGGLKPKLGKAESGSRGGRAAGRAPRAELFLMETEAVPGDPSPQRRQPAHLP